MLQLVLVAFFRPSMILLVLRAMADQTMTILRERQPSFSSMHGCRRVRAQVVKALGVAEGAASVEACVFVNMGVSAADWVGQTRGRLIRYIFRS
jgi:hypothetical protein